MDESYFRHVKLMKKVIEDFAENLANDVLNIEHIQLNYQLTAKCYSMSEKKYPDFTEIPDSLNIPNKRVPASDSQLSSLSRCFISHCSKKLGRFTSEHLVM